jgi:hypothetical protein
MRCEIGPANELGANRWHRKRITKKARAGRGQETKWEYQIKGPEGEVRRPNLAF